jgi:hypothetical protein
MCGGAQDAYAGAEPVIAAYARMCKLLGPAGSGQLTKMVNQICIAGLVQGLAEGIHFAKKAGLDVDAVIDTISKGAAQSWQMENRYKTMAAGKFDFGFAVDWMRKDLAICLGEARKNGATLPVSALVDQFYAEVQRMGGRRWDTSSLIARLERDVAVAPGYFPAFTGRNWVVNIALSSGISLSSPISRKDCLSTVTALGSNVRSSLKMPICSSKARAAVAGLMLTTLALISTALSLFAFMKAIVSCQAWRKAFTACGRLAMTSSRTKNTWVMKCSTNGVAEVMTRHSLPSSRG